MVLLLPNVDSFLGLDLRSATLMIATLGIVHPLVYCCTCFLPMSYLLVFTWMLITLHFGASVILFYGVVENSILLCDLWLIFSVVFVGLILFQLVLLGILFITKDEVNRVCFVLLGILWYLLTIYFIIIVNSYRDKLAGDKIYNSTFNPIAPEPQTTPTNGIHSANTKDEKSPQNATDQKSSSNTTNEKSSANAMDGKSPDDDDDVSVEPSSSNKTENIPNLETPDEDNSKNITGLSTPENTEPNEEVTPKDNSTGSDQTPTPSDELNPETLAED